MRVQDEAAHDAPDPVPALEKLNEVYDNTMNLLHETYEAMMTRILDNVYEATRTFLDILLSSIVPLIKISITCIILLFTSAVGYTILYRLLIPKDMINEPLYFNYNEKLPTARVQLLSQEQQWSYYRSGEPVQPKTCSAFFKANGKYDISLRFAVAKSARNQENRRCMVTVSMVDCSGDILAQSSRPLIIPYHSQAMSIMDVLIFWPKYLLGYGEIEYMTLNMMNNFRETKDLNIPTSHVEVTLSSPDLDIETSSITILPLPAGITWYLYHFPSMSLFSGVSIFFAFQAVLVILYMLVVRVMRIVNNEPAFVML